MEGKKLSLKDIGYKRLIVMFLAGAALVFFSVYDFDGGSETAENTPDTIKTQANTQAGSGYSGEEYINYCEEKLKNILSCVKGIDEAEVMITLEASAESVILKDTPYTSETVTEADSDGSTASSTSISREESTVMSKEGTSSEEPYVTKELTPRIAGVLIVAKGSITSGITLEIVGAVEALFNIPAHKIHIIEKK